MNHRYFSRTPIALKVKLISCEEELGVFITRDLNPDGMGIQGDFSQLRMRPLVRVKFIDPSLQANCEIKGLLVKHAGNSIGVMFNKPYQENINQILSQFQNKAVAA